MIGLNSYNISQNTKHCNSNAKATIQLSNGVALLADTFTRFIKTYAKDKKELNNNYFELDRDITDFRMKTILMDLQILNNHLRTVGNRLDNAIIKKKIIDLHKKPSFKYLKSITVYVAGETIPNITNKITREAFTDRWCGSGVIVKIDKNYTYILTNKHVVTDDKLCSIFIGKDKKTRRKVIEIKIHESQDLALVKIKGAIKGKQAIKGLAFPEITEKVYGIFVDIYSINDNGSSTSRLTAPEPMIMLLISLSLLSLRYEVMFLSCAPG